MILCDFCKREINLEDQYIRQKIHVRRTCNGWETIDGDICMSCYDELTEKINRTESELYHVQRHNASLMENDE